MRKLSANIPRPSACWRRRAHEDHRNQTERLEPEPDDEGGVCRVCGGGETPRQTSKASGAPRDEGAYQIVDGEHAYRALVELEYTEIPDDWCVIEQYDDFEAMRQTYKRNQHGTHDPLKQGLLFKRMMAERGLSQRALAEEMEISEGTVRNSYAYVEAAELRNSCADYADWQRDELIEDISHLTVRQVKALNSLPRELADLWMLKGGTGDLPDPYRKYDAQLCKLIPAMRAKTCRAAIEKMRDIGESVRLWGYYQKVWGKHGEERRWTGGLKLDTEQALPYLKLCLESRWEKTFARSYWMRDVLKGISRPDGEGAKIVMPLETFEAWIDYPDPMGFGELRNKLRDATIEIEPYKGKSLWQDQLQAYAPAIIRDSGLPKDTAYKLWQGLKTYEEDNVKKPVLDEALRRALAVLQNEKDIEPDVVLGVAVRDLTGEGETEEALSSFGTKVEMLATIDLPPKS